MKNWKVVKPQNKLAQENNKQPQDLKKSLLRNKKAKKSRFTGIGAFVAVVAVMYAFVSLGIFRKIGEKISSMPAMQPILTNEYFVLLKRLLQLAVLRAELLLIKGLEVAKCVLCRICIGANIIAEKVPGYEKAKGFLRTCELCKCGKDLLIRIETTGKKLLDSLCDKIRRIQAN
ncbi:hypothetical protein NEPAR04_0705 [Nematocida parisii]|nr:hypothetical protein NEPAR03_0708 [Nematocida parisii]KAI5126957.1 hypothetical protein NEPAR08_0707 [Nematocida parisii]KAI5141067.1 hypothetical protein NEPAR04_0705 [Nematocida parisii]